MLVILSKQMEWRRRSSVAYVAFGLGLSAHVWASAQASAQSSVLKDNQKSTNNRASSHMGVSAVVLPTCAVRIPSKAKQSWGQPVEVRCTQNTEYGLGASLKDGKSLSVRRVAPTATPTQQATGRRVIVQGDGKQNLFLIEQSNITSDRLNIGGTPVTILSIEF